MNKMTFFDDKERLEISKLLRPFSKRAQYNLEITMLIDRWHSFALSVKEGYTDSSYEYLNDLSVRDILQSLIDATTGVLQSKLLELTNPSDEMFLLETREIATPLRRDKSSNNWWWYRIPLLESPELMDGLFPK